MPISFNTYKITSAQKLYNRHLINKNDMREIMKAKTNYGFSSMVSDCFENKSENNIKLAEEIYIRGSIKPEEIPLVNSLKEFTDNLAVKFAKILSKKDTKPEVLEIKRQIKKEFGIKKLYLDNNFRYAKRVQKGLRILKENGIPLADEIIVNSMLSFNMGISNPKKKAMILNPNLKPDYSCSTNSIYHMIVHEDIHTIQPDNAVINFGKMPERYKGAISNLSLYADDNFIFEVHAELMAKKLLRPKEFTPKEQEALDYIEDLFRIYS